MKLIHCRCEIEKRSFIKQPRTRMAHFEDLSECLYLPGSEGLGFKAVGWLERNHDYPKGDVSAGFFEGLLKVLENAWAPFGMAGVHECQLCRFSGGHGQFDCAFGAYGSRRYRFTGVGNGFLFIPKDGVLYVSPSSIAHYIDAHEYRPPIEFQVAVMACPEMRSSAYFRALLATSARIWLQRINGKRA